MRKRESDQIMAMLTSLNVNIPVYINLGCFITPKQDIKNPNRLIIN